jgi:hypothetical protein
VVVAWVGGIATPIDGVVGDIRPAVGDDTALCSKRSGDVRGIDFGLGYLGGGAGVN